MSDMRIACQRRMFSIRYLPCYDGMPYILLLANVTLCKPVLSQSGPYMRGIQQGTLVIIGGKF